MTSLTDVLFRAPFEARTSGPDLQFDIYEPWYRSLPLSCLTAVEVVLDGRPVPDDSLSVDLGGRHYRFAELSQDDTTTWFVQDPARITVEGAAVDRQVRVEVFLTVRVPYIMTGPQRALVRHVNDEATLAVVRQ